MKVRIVVGNPNVDSRTRRVAEQFAERLFPAERVVEIVELAAYQDELFSRGSERAKELTARVLDSDVVILASPTYKASYTGLLKAFLDRYPERGLAGLTVIPVMTGGSAAHTLAPQTSLIPLLVELGAMVPSRGLYFITDQMERVDEIVAAAAADTSTNLSRAGEIAKHLH
jgi:FMN reductase